MNKSELSSRVAADASLSKASADSVIDAVFSTITDTLVCPAHQASPEECWCDLELAGVVLDRLGARCADRPGLTALSRVLGDDASAAPASSPAPRGALEQRQRKPHCAGIGGGSSKGLEVRGQTRGC